MTLLNKLKEEKKKAVEDIREKGIKRTLKEDFIKPGVKDIREWETPTINEDRDCRIGIYTILGTSVSKCSLAAAELLGYISPYMFAAIDIGLLVPLWLGFYKAYSHCKG